MAKSLRSKWRRQMRATKREKNLVKVRKKWVKKIIIICLFIPSYFFQNFHFVVTYGQVIRSNAPY